MPEVYLGSWVPESHKLAYKSRFRPPEIRTGGTWRLLTDADLGADEPAGALVPESAH